MRLDHIVFPVADIAESIRFYRDVLGLPLLQAIDGDDWDGYPWLMTMFGVGDGRQIVLVGLRGAPVPPPDARPKDARHVAFAVESIEPWMQRLRDHGVAWREEDHGDQRSIYFDDPDGLVLEITAPPSEDVIDREAGDVIDRWLKSR